jgi:hypothetical protein
MYAHEHGCVWTAITTYAAISIVYGTPTNMAASYTETYASRSQDNTITTTSLLTSKFEGIDIFAALSVYIFIILLTFTTC